VVVRGISTQTCFYRVLAPNVWSTKPWKRKNFDLFIRDLQIKAVLIIIETTSKAVTHQLDRLKPDFSGIVYYSW